ncbi:microrchidia 7-like protein, partial [Tanacetum coccineum]
ACVVGLKVVAVGLKVEVGATLGAIVGVVIGWSHKTRFMQNAIIGAVSGRALSYKITKATFDHLNILMMTMNLASPLIWVHPRFLHSIATSHKWALGAFAELLDNSLDEVRTGATYVKVGMQNNEKDTCTKMLLIEGLMADNGGGMTPDKMRGCMSLGYSEKRKLANSIGQCELICNIISRVYYI